MTDIHEYDEKEKRRLKARKDMQYFIYTAAAFWGITFLVIGLHHFGVL